MSVSTKLLAALLFLWRANAGVAAVDQTEAIGQLMSVLHERGQFNGCALVAVRGKVIYEGALGEANSPMHARLTTQSRFCLASVTKQFTAMAIMMLTEQNKLSYDAPASRFIVEFSHTPPLNQITIRQLLNHTSGIQDFGDLNMDDSNLSERNLISGLISRASALGTPGDKYRYSNPGYMLLALIVKRASGQSFGDFLAERIFKPLGMNDSYEEGAIAGDGGVYSTVDDLFKWDQALYTERLVRQSTLAEAFTPGKVRWGTCAYGFGWNVASALGPAQNSFGVHINRYVWHTGKTADWRAFIERRLDEKITVILLTNKGDSKRMEINDCILNLLAGKPFVLPKRPGGEMLYTVIKKSGIGAALKMFDSLKQAQNVDFDIGENELNMLGYKLLGDKLVKESIAIFKLNTTEHSGSSNAFDSLGEAYLKDGQKRPALESYEKAVSLDRANLHAAAMVKELK